MGRSDLIAAFQDTLTMSLSPALKGATEQASQSSRVYLENFHSDKMVVINKSSIIEQNIRFGNTLWL